MPRAALALLVVCVAAPSLAEEGEVLDRVMAVVDGHPITQSELELEARVALIQRGAVGAKDAPLDKQTLGSALELSIASRLQVAEADKLQAYPVEPQEVARAVQVFRDRLGSDRELEAFLKSQQIDLPELGAIFERTLRAEKVVDGKVKLRAQVTDPEVRRYFDSHRAEIPGGYDEVKGAIREKLMRERYQALVSADLKTLERAHDVRRLWDPTREDGQ